MRPVSYTHLDVYKRQVCDRTEFLASPVGVIQETNFKKVVNQVAIATVEYAVGMVVVGHPINMDGSKGARAQKCADFAEELRKRVQVPVVLWDERRSTITAHNMLNDNDVRGQKRKEIIDEVAATVILESYLDYRKNHPEEK